MNLIGRIRVREIHGIRRFLYPLTAALVLPEGWPEARLGLLQQNRSQVPVQITPEKGAQGRVARLDFAVSLAPHEETELLLNTDTGEAPIDDPIRLVGSEPYRCEQRRFHLEFDRLGLLRQAVYDGGSHLRASGSILRNGNPGSSSGNPAVASGPLAVRISAPVIYADGCPALTTLEMSACKSWVAMTHILHGPRPLDQVRFTLPLSTAAPALVCDFGVGGGIYGRLEAGSVPEIVWSTEFLPEGIVQWSWTAAGRLDYCGTEDSGGKYRAQRWFHIIDRDRALAVAITSIPRACRTMTVALNVLGDCAISFQLGEEISGPAAFGIRWHFLNGIPAVAAATNPQSILLPPLVELPAIA